MPYKLSRSRRSVLVKRGGRYVTLKRHATIAKARAHLTALVINVGRKHK